MQQNSLEKPLLVYIQQNQVLLLLVMGCQTLLQESSDSPTWCLELVGGWPDYIDVCDPFSHGMGGIILANMKLVSQPCFGGNGPMTSRTSTSRGQLPIPTLN